MKKKILLFVAIVAILVCVFAISVSADNLVPSDSNEYGTLSTVDGVPEPTVLDKNAKTVIVVNSKYYTIPTYYLLADNSYFTWSVHANVKTALGLGSDVRGNLVRVEIPEGIVTSYNGGSGGLKMESSTNLIEASIPTTMEIMGDHFFGKCTALTTIKGLENSKIDGVYTQAFYQNKFTSITLPSTVTTIGTNAFRDNPNLTSIVIPDNVTSIGDHAFASCTSLATITVSENSNLTQFVGEYQFEKTIISSFYFPSSLSSLGSGGTFYQCGSLETLINFENTQITAIPYRAFSGGPKFTTITFPDGIKTIGDNAFNGHKITGNIVLPNTVTALGDHAFAGSNVAMGKLVLGAGLKTITGTYTFEKTDFKEVYIPAGVTAFPQGAFKECLGSGSVYFYTGTQDQLKALLTNSNSDSNGNFKNATVASLAEYNAATDKTSKNYIVYGYSACDAFYNGAHNEADTVNGSACYLKDCSRCDVGELYIGGDVKSGTHTLAVEYVYANGYMQAGQIVSICSNPGCTHGTKETAFTDALEPIFKGLKYSLSDKGTGICVVYDIDQDAVAEYEKSGKTLKYGVAAAFSTNTNNGEIVKTDATVADGLNGVIVANVTDTSLKSVTFRIHGDKKLWENNNAKSLYMVGFATNGDAVEYLGESSGSADRTSLASVNAILISKYFPTQA